MPQIKIFVGIESDKTGLENDVNTWLNEQAGAIRVTSISGNIAPQTLAKDLARNTSTSGRHFSPSDILILIVYEKA
ncbi:MAG: hypothetical protein KF866_09150 [Phycisphaeraceae bacterium]|nr:hypothetical protein [Phycisphaeraceae bacterium]MCW5754664.1 hypothetical protein [Phycisphaeraceae bacterium]